MAALLGLSAAVASRPALAENAPLQSTTPLDLEAPLRPQSSIADEEPSAWLGSVGCFKVLSRRTNLFDVSAVGASNRFGSVDQHVGEIAATWGHCLNRRARLHVEASFAAVDEEGRKSEAGLFGLGYQAEITPNFTLTPIARVGFEHFGSGLKHVVYNGALVGQFARQLRSGSDAPLLSFVLRPELTDRRVASVASPGQRRSDVSFTNFVSGGLDFAVLERARAKVEVAHQYLSGATPTSSIGSVILSSRWLTSDRESYGWGVELWFSRGNGRYRSTLLGVSRRFGRK